MIRTLFLTALFTHGVLISGERPNIVLIMADDIGIEGLSCYGAESYETPRLDQLAADGVRFTHAYSQPLCTPTRVQIMTGRYNHRNWMYFGILDPEAHTFGHLMQEADYRTCIAGKWQLQSYDPPDWPNAADRRGTGMKVDDSGFDEWSLFHTRETEDKGSRYADPSYERNGEFFSARLLGPAGGGLGLLLSPW
ncbi:MAG: sulfatase-like hydrolase/transferase [Verrucomicrobiota bacterium]